MRPVFIALALTLVAAASGAPALAQGARPAPAAPPPVRIPGVSPAGNAALTRLQGTIDPAVVAISREDAAFRQQMAAVLSAPIVDVARLAAAMQRGEAVAAKTRALADGHLLEAVRVLPVADRAPFLRAIAQQQAQRQQPAR